MNLFAAGASDSSRNLENCKVRRRSKRHGGATRIVGCTLTRTYEEKCPGWQNCKDIRRLKPITPGLPQADIPRGQD